MGSLGLSTEVDPWALSFGALELAAPFCANLAGSRGLFAEEADAPAGDWYLVTRVPDRSHMGASIVKACPYRGSDKGRAPRLAARMNQEALPMATYQMVYGDSESVVRETFENIDEVEREDGWVVLFRGNEAVLRVQESHVQSMELLEPEQ